MSAAAPPRATLRVVPRARGTWTILLERPGQPCERWRTGIRDRAEAVHRARVVAELCGYRVRAR